MGVFFVVFGVSLGVYVGSFLLGQKRYLAVWLPAAISAVITLVMYVGEMILLSGNLYRFGSGWFFNGLGSLALAPVDCMIILLSGLISAGVLSALRKMAA